MVLLPAERVIRDQDLPFLRGAPPVCTQSLLHSSDALDLQQSSPPRVKNEFDCLIKKGVSMYRNMVYVY